MLELKADLHIHTALSPCADNAMTPRAIVDTALARGLGALAVCDHNTGRNAAAVCRAAAGRILAVPGIEITTAEEVHVLGWFSEPNAAEWVGTLVSASLPMQTQQSERHFGEQRLLDENDRPLGKEPRMLAAATIYSLRDAVRLIHQADGLAVAAHVDRPTFSVLSQLGVFPDDVEFDAVEISSHAFKNDEWRRYGRYCQALTTSSDSHFLEDIGRVSTTFRVAHPVFGDLVLALRRRLGRSCRVA